LGWGIGVFDDVLYTLIISLLIPIPFGKGGSLSIRLIEESYVRRG